VRVLCRVLNLKLKKFKNEKKNISPIYRCCNIIVINLKIVFLIPKIDEGYLIIYITQKLNAGAKNQNLRELTLCS